MRKNRVIERNRCYHLVSRLAHRAFFLDDEEKDRAVALMRRVEAGVQDSMSYCINRTVSISSDPFAPSLAMNDSVIWLSQTNIVSCSDSAIAPLVSSSARQLSSLTAARPSCSRSFDVRGNVTVSETLVDSSFVTSRQTLPYATNKPLSVSRCGVSLMEVSVSSVTNSYAYDSLGRQIAHTDGRGNTRHTEYNSIGQSSASIDALGNRTTYAYDQFGNLATVTDPLGNATVYEYDLRGRKTYEGGATYPARYTYDIFGNKTTMMTYRNESLGPDSGDVTTWLYDEASGCMTNKVYADGKGPTYSYTPEGKLSHRVWARGIVTDYSYDGWGNLTNTAYSDNTPTISITYDALGRQIEAHDAAGVTTFLYDAFGSLTNETVIGIAGTNVIERYWDDYGRTLGYALNGTRQSTLAYEPATGRLAAMLAAGSDTPFRWNYLDGSDLKSSLAYPNGLTASWQYDANNQLLQVCNTTPTNTISQYDYAYDAAGRRINMAKSGSVFDHNDSIAYGYNARSELTNAVTVVDSDYRYAYDFDGIGNRETSSERGTNSVYTANNLNQYTVVDDFTPQLDDDGNQTLVKTATGVWQISYNGENRPIHWANGDMVITMSYDRMGRRVTKNAQRFVYDGFLQIANFEQSVTNSQLTTQNLQLFIWDPTEPVATRPLVWLRGDSVAHYCHDGNKNVSEVVAENGDIAAHYGYAPFGAVTVQRGASASDNPWRFSSEYAEDDTATVYYNYRHYEPLTGRWMNRDCIDEIGGINLFLFSGNRIDLFDVLGLKKVSCDRVGNFNITEITVVINPAERAFDQNEMYKATEDFLRRLAKLGFHGTTAGLSNLGRILRLIYAGGDYLSKKKSDLDGGAEIEGELRDFVDKYLQRIFRIDGRLKYQLCLCRKGKLQYVDQEDILVSEEVDFSCAYDLIWYRNEINGTIKSVESALLEKLAQMVREAKSNG